jgi:hypothetical protein
MHKSAASGWNSQDGRDDLIFNFSLIFAAREWREIAWEWRVINRYGGHEAEFDEEFVDDGVDDEAPRPRLWVSALVCVALAATGSGAAFAWHGYGGGGWTTAALTSAPKAAPAPPQAAAVQDALLKSLTEGQQREAAIAQRNQELLQAQAAEIKRLSETVAQLATRVEALTVRNAQAAVPPPAPKKPAPKVVQHKPEAPAPLSLAPSPAPEGKK